MKKNYNKLTLVLAFIPFLMGNAPAPTPYTYSNEYKDFEMTFISESYDYKGYHLHYNLNNTGTGYIDYLSLYTEKDGYRASLSFEDLRGPFMEVLLPPGFNQEVNFESYNSSKYQDYKFSCTAFNEFDVLSSVEGTGEINILSKYEEYRSEYYVRCEYNVDYKLNYDKGGYNYAAIVEISYDGEPYYLKFDSFKEFSFATSQELDLSKVSTRVVAVVISEMKSANYYGGVEGAINAILIFFGVAFALLISFGIFAAIFFPTMARRRRKRLLEATKK